MSKTRDKFNPNASMTHEKRLENLKAKGKALDTYLRTPQSPKHALTPKGHLKQGGQKRARQQLQQQRINITEQVKSLEQHLKQKEKTKTKTRERGQ